ncbi:MAG: DUF4345 domain-containing protein [Actinomycetota bacterium]
MNLSMLLLRITSVLFVAFGIGFVVAPQDLAELMTDAAPSVPSAVTDMRATYGGVALGIGLFIGYCARRAETVRLGLLAAISVIASLGTARLIGIIIDGSPNAFMLVFLATEVASLLLLVIALRRIRTAAD